ncbi:peptidyl-prolyl cis-trans isomerase CYP38, chloroplastic-like isoform X2 [Zingiber officinale]|uniref:peptidyl-prolyl cis-trans isomerase CYP38, chloroplastic-like isoform X2 n=1 Tax=Zingiber officinale TaxID=94328 RepID=UPI001C4D0F9E|nr:peptidyl-prolyl cis-trans isomerase CYP38, chloroplastic-like isoform X2 [Zingiber officinale]
MQELEGIIQQRDREAVGPKQKELLQYVGGIEEDMVDGFPFEIPEEYSNLPLLKGKAIVDIKVKVEDNPNVQDCVFRIILDGMNLHHYWSDKTLTKSVSQHFESINTYIEHILVIPVRPCHVGYRNNLICHLQVSFQIF